MKGGFYIPRGVRLPLVLFALFGMAIFIWGGEKNPLAALFPPYGPYLGLSPGLVDPSVKFIPPEIHTDADNHRTTLLRNKTSKEKAAQSIQIGPKPNSTGEVKSASSRIVLPEKVMHVDNNQPSYGTNDEPAEGDGEELGKGIQNYSAPIMPDSSSEVTGLYPAIEEHKQAREKREISAEPRNASSNLTLKTNSDLAKIVSKETCNLAKGKWVADNTRPLYSGSGCKKWLSEMWACRLTNRIDFSFEKFRWQPHGCEMEEFDGAKFLKRMQDKTLAFIGDSLGRQQFQSLMCMITRGEERPDVLNVGWEYGLVKARGHVRPDGWAYRFPGTNTTILFYWSACLCNLEPLYASDPATDYAMHLDQPPAFLRRFLPRFDVLVLNTGHHWNRGKLTANRWVMHVGGVRNTNPKIGDVRGAKNLTIHSIVKWVDSQLPKHPKMKAFYRSISPRHFFNGDWNTGGTCDNTNPLSKGMEVLHDEPMDSVPASAVKGTKVKLLDITGLSQLRDEGHISRYSIRATPGMQDCLHWCLPGIPDTWNEILFAKL